MASQASKASPTIRAPHTPKTTKTIKTAQSPVASRASKATSTLKGPQTPKTTKTIKATLTPVTPTTKVIWTPNNPQTSTVSQATAAFETLETPKFVKFRNFPHFAKLPLEIRRRVWNLSFAPRVIRVAPHNTSTAKEFTQFYHITAGPVPRLLHVCKDSRNEGLRIFTLVASHLSSASSTYVKPVFNKGYTPKIYVDLENDTFYLTMIDNTINFLTWLRRFGHEKHGGAGTGMIDEIATKAASSKLSTHNNNRFKTEKSPKPLPRKPFVYIPGVTLPRLPRSKRGHGIRHLAVSGQSLIRLLASPVQHDLNFLLSVAMGQLNLLDIGIVLDKSDFNITTTPHQYELKCPVPLAQWDDFLAQKGEVPIKSWGKAHERAALRRALEGFWEKKRTPGLIAWNREPDVNAVWMKWIADERRRDGGWKAPEFVFWGLSKIQKAVL